MLLISAAAIGGYIVTGSDTNYPNVRINGIDVGGLTKEQTLAALDEQGWDDIVDKTLVVTLPAKVSFKVDYVTAGMKLSREPGCPTPPTATAALRGSSEIFSGTFSAARCPWMSTRLKKP